MRKRGGWILTTLGVTALLAVLAYGWYWNEHSRFHRHVENLYAAGYEIQPHPWGAIAIRSRELGPIAPWLNAVTELDLLAEQASLYDRLDIETPALQTETWPAIIRAALAKPFYRKNPFNMADHEAVVNHMLRRDRPDELPLLLQWVNRARDPEHQRVYLNPTLELGVYESLRKLHETTGISARLAHECLRELDHYRTDVPLSAALRSTRMSIIAHVRGWELGMNRLAIAPELKLFRSLRAYETVNQYIKAIMDAEEWADGPPHEVHERAMNLPRDDSVPDSSIVAHIVHFRFTLEHQRAMTRHLLELALGASSDLPRDARFNRRVTKKEWNEWLRRNKRTSEEDEER